MLPEVDAALDQRGADLERDTHRVGDGLHEIAERILLRRALLRLGGGRFEYGRAVRCHVGHRQQHLDERDAVGVAVVNANDDRAAAVVALDQVELPERPGRIERRPGEPRDERLELLLARGTRQRDVNQVMLDVEVVGRLPKGAGRRLHRPLAEAPEPEKPFLDRPSQRARRHSLREREHRADHHQVARMVHPEPSRVDRRDLVAPCHAKVGMRGRRRTLRRRLRAFSASR